MAKLKVQTQGLDEVIQAFKLGNRTYGVERKKGYLNIIKHIVPRIKAHTPVDTGRLRDSIEGRLSNRNTTIIIEAVDVPEVITASVEKGAVPHWPPWGPGSSLEGWANRKGIPVFLVARAISQRGTPGHFMFEKGMEESEDFINRETIRIGKRLARRFFK